MLTQPAFLPSASLPSAAPIAFPQQTPPEEGTVIQVAPGILWTRLKLPYLLNHVNIYLIEDHGGWAAIDTGLGTDTTKAAWEALFAGPLNGARLTRVVCTHYHPDHVGLVGWLTERFAIPLHMPRTEYLQSLAIQHRAFAANRPFYETHGLSKEATDTVTTRGQYYLRQVTGLPTQYIRLAAGEALSIGGRTFNILTGGGHAPEQAMLHCAEDNIFLSADQVLARISPNISVDAMEPEANPLGAYLTSLANLRQAIPEGALVLPGHHIPFTGLHTRIDELTTHHAERCAMIADACAITPHSAAELVPVLFKRELDAHQTSFAFSEVVAHVNYMRFRGELEQFADEKGALRTRAV
jgi:glyoxylase-like metal-dependent hydrolase (beta-lactamase superfamily II)